MPQNKSSLRAAPKWIWLVCILFLLMQYMISLNVFLMGDDYMYGTFGHDGVVSSVFFYYLSGNGRWFVNILDSLLLLFERYLFLALLPWLQLLFGFLLYRLTCLLTKTRDIKFFGIALGLLSFIDIQMTCETTYWVTGAMNYLFPALLFLAGMISALKMLSITQENKVVFCGILCVFSCLTMEQFGLMAIGWMLLLWAYQCFQTRSIPKRYLLTFLLSMAALYTIIFAPGNFVRVDTAAGKENSIIIKMMDLLYYDYYSKVSASFFFLLATLSAIWYYKNGKRKISLLSLLNAGILLLFFKYGFIDRFSSHVFVGLIFFSILLSALTIIPCLISVFKKFGIIYLVSLATIGIGSQIMLLATDLWGFRTSYAWVLILIIFALVLMIDSRLPNGVCVFSGILCMPVHPILGIVGLLLVCIGYFSKATLPRLSVCVLLLAILSCLCDEVYGYQLNRDVHLKNFYAAESARDDNLESIIVIHPYDEKQYGWNSPPFSEFHEKYFRTYYQIPDSDSIKYD